MMNFVFAAEYKREAKAFFRKERLCEACPYSDQQIRLFP